MEGLILKGIGGFYTVLAPDGSECVCRVRGRLRLDDIVPSVGDRIEFAFDGRENAITSILPRRNSLTRPAVANLDKLFIVLAVSAPKPDLFLADRLLLECESERVTPIIVLNKCDSSIDPTADDIAEQYRPAGYTIIRASALTGEGVDIIKSEITNSVCTFAGQSAVGKSSLMNAIAPELSLEVGGLSRKTERGRHTTRAAELFRAHGGALVDTPGFSLLESEALEPEELWKLYPEMRPFGAQCRFPGCMHITEPDCAVKPLLESHRLSSGRYERYKLLAGELKEKRKHKYD